MNEHPPPISSLRKSIQRCHLERLKEIIIRLHPEKKQLLRTDADIIRNASKKSILCLFRYDRCLENAPKDNQVVDDDMIQFGGECLVDEEEAMMQAAIKESLDAVSMVDRAYKLVRDAADEARRVKQNADVDAASRDLVAHMIPVLPILAGLISAPTESMFEKQYERFVYDRAISSDRQTQYLNFVKTYMFRWLAYNLVVYDLDGPATETVVANVLRDLDASRPLPGW